jgi:hypothetical protein
MIEKCDRCLVVFENAIAAFCEVIFSLRSRPVDLYQDSSELILHPLIHNGDRFHRYRIIGKTEFINGDRHRSFPKI